MQHPEWFQQREAAYSKRSRTKAIDTRPWKYILKSRMYDARKRGIEFSLTDEWAAARWTGHCELTGIPFDKPGNGLGPKPFSPSVDRIDQSKGYLPTNARFVLWAVNAMRGVGSDEAMYEIAAALLRKRPT